MKITITTTYTNVSKAWVDAYVERLRTAEVLPGSKRIAADLKKKGFAVFTSEDPTSDSVGVTTYEIDREDAV